LGLVACQEKKRPELPPGISWLETSDNPLQWSGPEFIQVVTPIRPPTSKDGTVHIAVFLKIPKGTKFSLDSVKLPAGSMVFRIEYAGTPLKDAVLSKDFRVLDVRQFEWTDAGIFHSVLRPAGNQKLVGLRWKRGEISDAMAGQALADLLRNRWILASDESTEREKQAQHLHRINGCESCHQSRRSEDRRPGTVVQRGTDALGLFSVRSLFVDEDSVERYRPVDSNQGDPLMNPVCPEAEINFETQKCADGLNAKLHLNILRGMTEKSEHVLSVCQSREQMWKLFDENSKQVLAAAISECSR